MISSTDVLQAGLYSRRGGTGDTVAVAELAVEVPPRSKAPAHADDTLLAGVVDSAQTGPFHVLVTDVRGVVPGADSETELRGQPPVQDEPVEPVPAGVVPAVIDIELSGETAVEVEQRLSEDSHSQIIIQSSRCSNISIIIVIIGPAECSDSKGHFHVFFEVDVETLSRNESGILSFLQWYNDILLVQQYLRDEPTDASFRDNPNLRAWHRGKEQRVADLIQAPPDSSESSSFLSIVWSFGYFPSLYRSLSSSAA